MLQCPTEYGDMPCFCMMCCSIFYYLAKSSCPSRGRLHERQAEINYWVMLFPPFLPSCMWLHKLCMPPISMVVWIADTAELGKEAGCPPLTALVRNGKKKRGRTYRPGCQAPQSSRPGLPSLLWGQMRLKLVNGRAVAYALYL
jgi:hypothetical protein